MMNDLYLKEIAEQLKRIADCIESEQERKKKERKDYKMNPPVYTGTYTTTCPTTFTSSTYTPFKINIGESSFTDVEGDER